MQNTADQTLVHTDTLPENGTRRQRRRIVIGNYWALLTLIAFLVGSVGGYLAGYNRHAAMQPDQAEADSVDMSTLMERVNPPKGHTLDAHFGDISPQLIAAGAFEPDSFAQVYERAGQPLNDQQLAILKEGSDAPIVFDGQNAYFLLNFFWAFGLANQNPILENGPMVSRGREQVVNFASTGGWSLATRPVGELYGSTPIVTLTAAQQERLEQVAPFVYRPCCDNPTHFPDCNHGMAMLGLLELMASQDASVDEMFEAAKYANAFWYPRQYLELAAFFEATQNVTFDKVNARELLSGYYSSLSGFQNVHQWLSTNGVLPELPGGGSNCGV